MLSVLTTVKYNLKKLQQPENVFEIIKSFMEISQVISLLNAKQCYFHNVLCQIWSSLPENQLLQWHTVKHF